MKNIVVITDVKQYEEFVRKFPNASKFQVFTDNLSFAPFLMSKFSNVTVLKEAIIEDRWYDINSWSAEKALNWNSLDEKVALVEGVEMHKVLYMYFTYYLMSFVKNYLYAKHIFNISQVENVVDF